MKKLLEKFHTSILEVNELLCSQKGQSFSRMGSFSIFELLFSKKLNQKEQFPYFWAYLRQALRYERTEVVLDYWALAHQYFVKFFVIDDNSNPDEEEQFLEFQYALGGLLMYYKQYECIKSITEYTNQFPVRYYLVPERMDNLIERYLRIDKGIDTVYYAANYKFPGLSTATSNSVIEMWIKRYYAVLFLRQYILKEVSIEKLPISEIVINLSDYWETELTKLDEYIQEYLSDKIMLKQLGLQVLGNDNFFTGDIQRPSVIIADIIAEIKNRIAKDI